MTTPNFIARHAWSFSFAVSLCVVLLAPTLALADVTVQSGDTLSKLYPDSWQQVCHDNGLADCNRIYPGQILHDSQNGGLKIATTSAPTAAPAGVPGLSVALNSAYVYGGTSPGGYDCSGLTQWLSAQRGIRIPRTTQGQISALPHISLSAAQPGDVIAFNYEHVGTYVGGGKVVQALNPTQGIRVTTVAEGVQFNGYLTTLAVR